jgi:hypothetical protein
MRITNKEHRQHNHQRVYHWITTNYFHYGRGLSEIDTLYLFGLFEMLHVKDIDKKSEDWFNKKAEGWLLNWSKE